MITHIGVAVTYVADQRRSADLYVGRLGFANEAVTRKSRPNGSFQS